MLLNECPVITRYSHCCAVDGACVTSGFWRENFSFAREARFPLEMAAHKAKPAAKITAALMNGLIIMSPDLRKVFDPRKRVGLSIRCASRTDNTNKSTAFSKPAFRPRR